MDNSIHIPLDLPDVRVLEVSQTDQGHWLIRIESTLSGTTCHQCGRQLTHFHGFDHAIRLRHLPVFDTPVFVEFRPGCAISVIIAKGNQPQRNGLAGMSYAVPIPNPTKSGCYPCSSTRPLQTWPYSLISLTED